MFPVTRKKLALPPVLCLLVLAPCLARAAGPATQPTQSDLSAQERDVLNLANDMARRCSEVIERWLASNEVSEDRLFSAFYYPIASTDPPKFTTDWDRLSDRDVLAIEEAALAKSPSYLYAVLADRNGYVPTHNQRYAQPLTGNGGVDLENNRTKRIYADRVGLGAARNTGPFFIQRYSRDDGQTLLDLSVPVMVRGKHFGSVRIGFRPMAQ